MRISILLLLIVSASIGFAADILDERIPFASTLEEVVKRVRAIEERLPSAHLYAFKLARSELIDPLGYETTGLSQEERDVVASRSIAGLTIRQLILIGHQVRILRASIEAAKHPADAKDVEAEIRDSTIILRRYAKGANQMPQRNAGSRPSSTDSSASETSSSLGPRR